jgi:hypothetical protein
MPTGVLGCPIQDEALPEGLVVCKSLVLKGYDWICLTLSDPRRICKKFRKFKKAVKHRWDDSSGRVTVQKGGWEGEPRERAMRVGKRRRGDSEV